MSENGLNLVFKKFLTFFSSSHQEPILRFISHEFIQLFSSQYQYMHNMDF